MRVINKIFKCGYIEAIILEHFIPINIKSIKILLLPSRIIINDKTFTASV